MAEKVEVKKLVAYAPFTFRGKSYKIGDVFNPGELVRDFNFEEFRNMDRQHGEVNGIPFVEVLPPATPKGDPIERRVVLPLKEA